MSEPEPTPPESAPHDPGYGSLPYGQLPYGSVPYGSVPYGPGREQGSAPSEPTERPLVQRADLWAALLGTLAVVPLGALAALIWAAFSPRVAVVKNADGSVSLVDAYTKGFVGADVSYLIITVVAGLVCGVVAALIARHRGSAVAVSMAAGGFLAAWLMAWLGRWLTGGPASRWNDHASAGPHHYFIQLQARPFLMAWPVAALAVTFVVALVADSRSADTDQTPGIRP